MVVEMYVVADQHSYVFDDTDVKEIWWSSYRVNAIYHMYIRLPWMVDILKLKIVFDARVRYEKFKRSLI